MVGWPLKVHHVCLVPTFGHTVPISKFEFRRLIALIYMKNNMYTYIYIYVYNLTQGYVTPIPMAFALPFS